MMHISNFWLQKSEKIPWIIYTDVLEFITAKSILILTFVQLFIQFVSTKNKNLLFTLS